MQRSASLLGSQLLGQQLEEIHLQHFRYTGQYGSVYAVALQKTVHCGAVTAYLIGKPSGRTVLSVQLVMYQLSYIYHIALEQNILEFASEAYADTYRQSLATHEILQMGVHSEAVLICEAQGKI